MADPKGLSMEQWKQVVCNDRYEVSNQGRIRRAVCGKATRPGRILKPKPVRGYLQTILYAGSKSSKRHFHIHRLVLEAFVGPANGKFTNHKDRKSTRLNSSH